MRNFVQVTQVTSNNCGGNGAWMDNPLNTPSPGNSDWPGFQGGGGGRKRKMRKMRKTRQVRKRRLSRKTKKRQSKFR